MSNYTKDHMSRALTWLEQHVPHGTQLVARALSETAKPNKTYLEIPLEKTIDRVARLEGGIPVGDPQDPEDVEGEDA